MSDLAVVLLSLLGGGYLAAAVCLLERHFKECWRQDPPRVATGSEFFHIIFLGPAEEAWLLAGIFISVALEKFYLRLRPR